MFSFEKNKNKLDSLFIVNTCDHNVSLTGLFCFKRAMRQKSHILADLFAFSHVVHTYIP